MKDTLNMLRGSIEHERQVAGIEKAQKILEIIKLASIQEQIARHSAGADLTRWLQNSEKYLKLAEQYSEIVKRMTQYYRKHLVKLIGTIPLSEADVYGQLPENDIINTIEKLYS